MNELNRSITLKIETLFPLTISQSVLEDALHCDMFFFRKHIQKLYPEKNQHLIAGGNMAKAIELVRRAYFKDKLSVEDAVEIGYNHILDAPETGDEIKSNTRLAFLLKKYFERFPIDQSWQPIPLKNGDYAIEYEFEFDLGIPHPDISDRNVTFSGKLDMLAEKRLPGGIRAVGIVDEKTTKSVKRVAGTKFIDMVAEEETYLARGQLACLVPEHEVLTRNGWVTLPNLPKGEEILCWSDGKMFFDTPTAYIEKIHKGKMIEYQGLVNIKGTDDHRQVVRNRKNNTYKTVTLDTIPTAFDKYQFITAGFTTEKTNRIYTEDFLRFLVAVQADGCWSSELKKGKPAIQFQFSKQRKVNRLKELLDKLQLEYSFYERPSAVYSTGSSKDFRIKYCPLVQETLALLGKDKTFPNFFYGLGIRELNTVVEELFYWDGYINKNGQRVYTSTNKANIEIVSTIGRMLGYNTCVNLNCNSRRNPKHSDCWNVVFTRQCFKAVNRQKKIETYETTKVYCVEVPSSYFVTRYKGSVVVTGNCYSWSIRQLGLTNTHGFIRRIPVLKDYEPAYELTIPVSEFFVENWSKTMFNTVSELVEKYKFFKEKLDPFAAFSANYTESCNPFFRSCDYKIGCTQKDGEEFLLQKYPQMVYDRFTEETITIKEYKNRYKI